MATLVWEQPALFEDLFGSADDTLTVPQRKRQAFIEDVEWLLATGCGWHEICRRLDSKPGAIAKRLNRCGRNDLADIFWRIQKNLRTAGIRA